MNFVHVIVFNDFFDPTFRSALQSHLSSTCDQSLHLLQEYFPDDGLPRLSIATLPECLALVPSLTLLFQLMGGMGSTLFHWIQSLFSALILGPSVLLTLRPHVPHHTYKVDVRFWAPVAIDLYLPYRVYSFPSKCKRSQHKSKLQPRNYGLRVRYRQFRYRKSVIVNPTYSRSKPTEEDTASSDKAVDSSNLNKVYHNPLRHLQFEHYYGMSRERAWELLSSYINPLDWYHHEQLLLNRPIVQTQREHKILEKAYIAANSILRELGAERSPLSTQQGVFLTNEHRHCEVPIVIDTGASFALTPFQEDYVSDLEPSDITEMHGLNDSVQVKGVGWVEWTVRDAFGQAAIIRTRAYYVPSSNIRLFSPQSYFGLHERGHAYLDHRKLIFTTADDRELEFPYNPCSFLPLMFLNHTVVQVGITGGIRRALTNSECFLNHSILDNQNYNLSGPAKELLLWHDRLAHASCSWVQSLMRPTKGEVGVKNPPLLSTKYQQTKSISPPKCAGCQLAKQHRSSANSQVTSNIPERERAIRRSATAAGDQVSIDLYSSPEPGRLAHTYGKERPTERYTGGSIFVDHFSSLIKIYHQVHASAAETLLSKGEFESFAQDFGVKIRSYRADNQPFDAAIFVDDIEVKGQTINYSGVGAHHQNGVAERAIQTVTNWARAMMMHQLLRWPDQFDPKLWPFAMDYAVHIWNNLPRQDTGLSPLEMFTGQLQPTNGAIKRARVWGCPAYVLNPALQDGKKLPKWDPRSRIGVYLGCSSSHHTTVGLILKPETGHISPQFHVVYDERFETVYGHATPRAFDSELWESLLVNDAIDQRLTSYDRERAADDRHSAVIEHAQDLYRDFIDSDDDDSSCSSASEGEVDESPFSSSSEPSAPEGVISPNSTPDPDLDPDYITRSGRRVKKPRYVNLLLPGQDHGLKVEHRYQPYVEQCYLAGGNPRQKVRSSKLQDADLHGIKWDPRTFLLSNISDTRRALQALLEAQNDGYGWHHRALAAKGEDPEFNPTWEQAMNGPLADGYWEAARKEIDTLIAMGVWEVVERKPWMNVLPAVWAFRKKVYPSGLVRKLKARLCVGGHRQKEGKDYWSTFAPTVSWTTVRLLLILSVQMQLATRQVDYTAAFVHADIDKPPNYEEMSDEEKEKWGVFVEMPRGFVADGQQLVRASNAGPQKGGQVLRLKKSLYGLRQAPRNFFLHLRNKLEAVGFQQATEIDPCLFISDKVICLVYVDDTLLFAREMSDIDEVLRQLVDEQGMALEVEDDVAGFLGVHIAKDEKTGELELTQRGLINRIVEALGADKMDPVSTPANTVIGSDEDGDPPAATFNYASVIGMLWYVYGHSRPDIGYAVSSAARYSFRTKRSHELALIRIGCYLKGTANRGLRLKPLDTRKFELDVYVDSDFMGLYGKEKRENPDNVKSRAGHVMLLNGCPIIWSSKLMQQIALSTMMAEYYALSAAMKEVLPLIEVIKAVAKGFGIDESCVTEFRTTVWEDNMGALTLAQLDPGQHTVRSKFYDVRVHWFRSILHAPKSKMSVKKVESTEQLADLFTKPLPEATFQYLRKKLLGW